MQESLFFNQFLCFWKITPHNEPVLWRSQDFLHLTETFTCHQVINLRDMAWSYPSGKWYFHLLIGKPFVKKFMTLIPVWAHNVNVCEIVMDCKIVIGIYNNLLSSKVTVYLMSNSWKRFANLTRFKDENPVRINSFHKKMGWSCLAFLKFL